MFKQLLGEKLTTFNSPGKSAMEWMSNSANLVDKFKQTLDISDKLQQLNNLTQQPQQQNMTSGASDESLSSISQNNNGANSTTNSENINNTVNNLKKSFNSKISNLGLTLSNLTNGNNQENFEFNTSLLNTKQTPINSPEDAEVFPSPPRSPAPIATKPTRSSLKEQTTTTPVNLTANRRTVSTKRKSLVGSSFFNKPVNSESNQSIEANLSPTSGSNTSSSTNSSEAMTSSIPSNNSSNDNIQQHHHQPLSPSVSHDPDEPELLNQRAKMMLVRQSTELTSSFPLKSFQKINSETVEIPGLNVKVVRYRVDHDLGRIEPHLYKKGIAGGVDSNANLSKGKLQFTLRYTEDTQTLSIIVGKAEIFNQDGLVDASGHKEKKSRLASLSSLSSSSSSSNSNGGSGSNKSVVFPDTYVRIQLLPDHKKRKYQTKIQRKTFRPVFDERFQYQLPFDELQNKTLYLSHFEFGRFGKHELIGTVRLNDLHLIKDLTATDIDMVKNLIPLAEDDFELGELTLTLCYLPAAGRLTVTIVKAINLKAMDINGKSDPYVKVTIAHKGKRLKKKKTSVMKNTLHPVFNESMVFDVATEQIAEVDMIVKVIDYDRVGQNELIGCVGIGPSFNGVGRDHWFRMLENHRKPMTQTYYLRDASILPASLEKGSTVRQESNDSSKASE